MEEAYPASRVALAYASVSASGFRQQVLSVFIFGGCHGQVEHGTAAGVAGGDVVGYAAGFWRVAGKAAGDVAAGVGMSTTAAALLAVVAESAFQRAVRYQLAAALISGRY